jgi:hypothetical protein
VLAQQPGSKACLVLTVSPPHNLLQVLSKYISLDTSTGTGEGLLAGLKDKLTKMWSDWASSSEGLHVFSQLHQDLHSSSSKAGGRGNKFGDEWKRAVADMMSQVRHDLERVGVALATLSTIASAEAAT